MGFDVCDFFALGERRQQEAAQVVAFGSGMAASTAVLLALQEHGRHVVAVRPLYGGSDHLLATGLLGTGSVPVLVDSTFATPILQRPLEHGAAMVLHSATKFLGGHGDVIAGVVACSAELAGKLRQVRILTGAILHPLGAFLLLRGLATLRLRVLEAQDNALLLATRLARHPAVDHVYYPARARGRQAAIMHRQMSGPGCVIAFELMPGMDSDLMLQTLQLITPAVSLGSVDTLIQRPAALTHRVVDPKARAEGGVREGLMRLSVGIEDAEDLRADLKQAIESSGHGMARAA